MNNEKTESGADTAMAECQWETTSENKALINAIEMRNITKSYEMGFQIVHAFVA